jgi:PAS domain S-box-containing protein
LRCQDYRIDIQASELMMSLLGVAFAMREPETGVFAKSTIFAVEPRSAKALLVAVGCTIAAWGLRWAIGFVEPGVAPLPVFLASTLVAAAWAGIPAGAFAAALGFVLSWLAFFSASPGTFSPAGIALYAFSAVAVISVAERYRGLVRRLESKETAFRRQLSLIQEENDALAQIASDVSLPQTLGKLTQTIERYCEGRTVASVMLLDPDGSLRIGAAPRLSEAFSAAIDGKQIGPAAGSCGTAAYRKLPVYVTDIETDPLWADYRQAALQHGLVSCWSVPIMSKNDTVLGTFAVYHREKREPSEEDKQIVALLTRIAALAIEHENDKMQRRRGEEVAQRLAAIVQSSEDAIVGKDLNGTITSWNGSAERLFGYTAEDAIGKPITILIPEDRLQEEADIIRRLRSGQHVEHFETVRRRQDGTPIEISVAVSPIKNSAGEVIGASKTARDITERKRRDERIVVLAREAEHRSKNLLATVQATIRLTQADTPADLKEAIAGRIQALAHVHALFVETKWAGADVQNLVAQELSPYCRGEEKRAVIDGVSVMLQPDAAQAIAVCLHELATNAAKYGALSLPGGRVHVDWSMQTDGRIIFHWSEAGGPAVAEPTRRGFGMHVMQRMIKSLNGEVRLDWRPEGLACEITLAPERRAG